MQFSNKQYKFWMKLRQLQIYDRRDNGYQYLIFQFSQNKVFQPKILHFWTKILDKNEVFCQ